MSPDEEKMLELLLKKQDEERSAAGAPVFRLFPGGKTEKDSGAVLKLKEFVRRVEAGELTEFEVIGVTPDGMTLDARYSHAKPTFTVLGATLSVLILRTRSLFR